MRADFRHTIKPKLKRLAPSKLKFVHSSLNHIIICITKKPERAEKATVATVASKEQHVSPVWEKKKAICLSYMLM